MQNKRLFSISNRLCSKLLGLSSGFSWADKWPSRGLFCCPWLFPVVRALGTGRDMRGHVCDKQIPKPASSFSDSLVGSDQWTPLYHNLLPKRGSLGWCFGYLGINVNLDHESNGPSWPSLGRLPLGNLKLCTSQYLHGPTKPEYPEEGLIWSSHLDFVKSSYLESEGSGSF